VAEGDAELFEERFERGWLVDDQQPPDLLTGVPEGVRDVAATSKRAEFSAVNWLVTVPASEKARSGAQTMATILFVRISSSLDPEEFDRRLLERRPRFLEVPGLVQKIYGRDPETGHVCGIYFFESEEALAAFRDSELAQTIQSAYEATDVHREVYEVLYPLRPEQGPLIDTRAPATTMG
jgi:Putative mono-oxygenase ydhR